MCDELKEWINNNLSSENDTIYKFDKTIFKRLQYNNKDKLFMDIYDTKKKYNNTYKSFIKIMRQALNKNNIKIKYEINYIYSTYDIIYYIHLQ